MKNFWEPLKKSFRDSPSYWIPLLLLVALALAYSNSFHGPFIYDDAGSIEKNPSIRNLARSIIPVFYGGEAVTGRPMVNFTLALNYAMGGLAVEGYHLMNFGIHLLATLTLFGFLRRTLQLPSFSDSIRRDSSWIAGSIAALWSLHPLQTESVTYIVERSESLMGLFYLLTLYCFLRSQNSTKSWQWLLLSVFCCYCSVGSKEVAVSIPFIVLFYDGVFIERKFQNLWKRRRFYYYGLLSSWILLAYMIVAGKGRGTAIGFYGKISFGENLQTQMWALCHYLKLVFWPDPLILDYGVTTVTSLDRVLPSLLVILLTLGGIGWLLRRSAVWGFWGIWGVLIMIPSSIVPISTETIVEHRVYLALAPLLFYLVLFGYRTGGKIIFPIVILLSMALGFRTYQRNEDYRSEESLWKSTVLHAPFNPRAHNNYAGILYSQRKWKEAEAHLQEAIRLAPDHLKSYLNYGTLYQEQGKLQEAEQMYRKAISINAFIGESWHYLGVVLTEQDKIPEAMEVYQRCLKINPQYTMGCGNLANLYLIQGKIDKAMELYRRVIEKNPTESAAYLNLGGIFEHQKQWVEAEAIYLEALQNDVNPPEIIERLKKVQEKLLNH